MSTESKKLTRQCHNPILMFDGNRKDIPEPHFFGLIQCEACPHIDRYPVSEIRFFEVIESVKPA